MKFLNRHAYIKVVIDKTYFFKPIGLALKQLTGNFVKLGSLIRFLLIIRNFNLRKNH